MPDADTPRVLIDIGPLLAESGGSLHIADTIEVSGLAVGEDVFEFLGPVECDIRLDGTLDLVVLSGTVSVPTRVACVRCLEPFEFTLSADLDVCMVEPGEEETLPEEQERHLIDDEIVDVWPVLLSALGGAAPFAPVHDEACLGLCSSCGIDLNAGSCDCETDVADSPFAALQGMFGEDDAPDDP